MKKSAALFLADGFEEIEAITCADILQRAGIKINLIGINCLWVKGCHQIIIKADKIIGQIKTGYDAYILPGGMPGAANLAKSKKLTALIKTAYKKKKVIAAICAAPAVILSPLGLLNGKKATCYPGLEKKFSPSTLYQKEKVIIDANIITAQGPAAALEFALKISEKILGKKECNKVRKSILL